MKRLGLAFAFCALLICSASAQLSGGLIFPGPGTAHSSGGGSATLVTGKYAGYQNGYAGSRSFASMNGGTNYPSGSVVIVFVVASDATAFTSPQMGSVSLTALASATNVSQNVQVFYASLPSGAVDTFTFSNQGCCNRFGAYAVYFTGVTVGTIAGAYQSAFTSQADPQLANTPSSLTVPTGGFGVIFEGNITTGTASTSTFVTTTPSFLTSSAGDPTGSTCASPGGTGCSTVTSTMVMSSAHTTTAGAGWVGQFTTTNPIGFAYATAAIVIGP